jgi:hypothetical protein
MVDIQTVSVAIASASVTLAAIYYIWQIRHQNKVRQTDLIMRLYSTWGTMEFQEAWKEVMTTELEDFKKAVGKLGWSETYAVVSSFFEGIGVLLYRELIDISLVDDLLSGPTQMTWERIEPIIRDRREYFSQPQMMEWFEYLYNEMKKREQRK